MGIIQLFMKKQSLKIIYKTLIFLGMILTSFNFTNANILSSQLGSSATLSNGTNYTFYQDLGTGLNGEPVYVDFYTIDYVAGGTETITIEWYECTTTAYRTSYNPASEGTCTAISTGNGWDNSTENIPDNNTKTLITVTNSATTPFSFDPTKYYVMAFVQGGGALDIKIYGANTDLYTEGNGFAYTTHQADMGNVIDFYFSVSDEETLQTGTLLNWVRIDTPTTNQNFSNFNINFSGEYNYGTGLTEYTYDSIGYVITNIGDMTIIEDTDTIVEDTNTNFSFNYTLTNNKSYSFYAYYFDSLDLTKPFFYSEKRYFSLGDGGGIVGGDASIPPEENCAQDFGFTGAVICAFKNILNWAFLPSDASLQSFSDLTLENTFPFSYLYDVTNLYDEAFGGTATDFELTIPFGESEITIISTDMLEAISFQSLVRTIMGAIMIFMTAMLIYKRVMRIHDNNHRTV